ncbi:IPT/TIG domain-containing protein [Actinoplanes sp. NPDC048796]|uniref:IPT/TIG domain-containing protein n=1 Tax=Actinoplanes sp. NPDC048796 TaxID=3155640 RepID=UPI003406E5F1
MRKSATHDRARRRIRAGLATAATVAVALGISAAPAQAAVGLTLSQTSGPSTGGNTITATTATSILAGYNSPVVYFTQATCPASIPANQTGLSLTGATTANTGVVQATVVKKIADNKVAVTVPAGVIVVGTATTTKYNVCLYPTAAATTLLGANTTYSVSAAATVTGITPSTGPSLGGTTITVTGTNFPTTSGSITATVGGTAATVTPGTNTQFTITAPQHAPAAGTTISITTSSGTINRTLAYDYINGLSVMPNTAPSSKKWQDVDVFGTDLLNYNFTGATTPPAGPAKVLLVQGDYDPTVTNTNQKTKAQISECINVLVIADDELVCTLILSESVVSATNFSGGEIQANWGTGQAARDLGAGATTGSDKLGLTVTNGGLKQSDVGLPVTLTGATLTAGTTIASVTSSTTATLSAPASVAGPVTAINVGGVRTLTSLLGFTQDSTSVTGGANAFTTADIGRQLISSGNTRPGTIIMAVSADGATATVSRPAIATQATQTGTVGNGDPVPDGAYNLTIVSNSGTYATANDLTAAVTAGTYKESVVSSGATFTVAPF